MANKVYELDRNNTSFQHQLLEYYRNNKWDETYDFLKYYQNIIRLYMTADNLRISGSRGLLITVEMGLGKTLTAIAVAMELLGKYKPIILSSASLKENFKKEVRKYIDLRSKYDPDYALARMSADARDQWIMENYSFVSLNASNMTKQVERTLGGKVAKEYRQMLENQFGEVMNMGSLRGRVLIVDEAHNWFRAIVNGSKNATGLYNMVMSERDVKLVFLTGTPIVTDPFEIVPIFNMLGSDFSQNPPVPLLPTSYRDFYNLYIDDANGVAKNEDRLKNRLFGMVSSVRVDSVPGKALGYNVANNAGEFPELLPIIVKRVNMTRHQYGLYKIAEDSEIEETKRKNKFAGEAANLTKPKGKSATTYRVKTRQLSNNGNALGNGEIESPKFDDIYEDMTSHDGELKLFYSQFEGAAGVTAFASVLKSHGYTEYKAPKKHKIGGLEGYGDTFDNPMPDISRANWARGLVSGNWDKDGNEIAAVIVSGMGNDGDADGEADGGILSKYITSVRPRTMSGIDKYLSNTSDACEHIVKLEPADLEKKGIVSLDAIDCVFPNCTYAKLVNGEPVAWATAKYGKKGYKVVKKCGDDNSLAKFTKLLEGPKAYKIGKGDSRKSATKFAIISGNVSMDERVAILSEFTSAANKYGELIEILLVTSTGAEGLDLKNIRRIYITEPYWNWSRIEQINARGKRNNSHIDLPAEHKNVQPIIYLSIPPEEEIRANPNIKRTTDEDIYYAALKNFAVIQNMTNVLREVSIECLVNDDSKCYKCTPDNNKLYTNNPSHDIQIANPCKPCVRAKLSAKHIVVDGKKYNYVADPTNIYGFKVYVFDDKIGENRQVMAYDPVYEKVIGDIRESEGMERDIGFTL